MILHRRDMQAFECSICHRGREIPRHLLANPEEFTAMRERFAKVHASCETKRKLLQPSATEVVQ